MTETKKKSLAVVIPTTGRKTLDETLESVLNQSVLPEEIIVFDNSGSNTVKKESKWRYCPDVQWCYSDEKKDIITSWNTAVSQVKADYTYVLGDDDCMLKDFVSTVKKQLQQGYDMLYIPPLYWLKNNQLIDSADSVKIKGKTNFHEFAENLLCDEKFPALLGTIVFSTKVFKKIKGYKSIITNALAMDHLFHLETAFHSDRIFAVEKSLWKYRSEVDDWNGRITSSYQTIKLGFQFKKFFSIIKEIFLPNSAAEKKIFKKYLTSMIQVAFPQQISLLRYFTSLLICFYPYHSISDNIFLLRLMLAFLRPLMKAE